jgi:hypothetical protein
MPIPPELDIDIYVLTKTGTLPHAATMYDLNSARLPKSGKSSMKTSK